MELTKRLLRIVQGEGLDDGLQPLQVSKAQCLLDVKEVPNGEALHGTAAGEQLECVEL